MMMRAVATTTRAAAGRRCVVVVAPPPVSSSPLVLKRRGRQLMWHQSRRQSATSAGGGEAPGCSVSRDQLWQVFLHAAVPMVGFGAMDNMVMIQAGELIDETIGVRFGLATLTAAAFGQIASDVSGVCFGGVVEGVCSKLGLTVPQISNAQRQLPVVKMTATVGAVVGVVCGCLLGMSSLLFLDLEAAERQKRDKELEPVFKAVISEGTETLRAERSSLFILDRDTGLLWSRVATGVDETIANKLDGTSLVAACVRTGTVVNVPDAYDDDRFDETVDLRTGFRTKAVLCVPVFDASDPTTCVGAVQVINKRPEAAAAFSQDDVRTAQMLARHVAMFLAETSKSGSN